MIDNPRQDIPLAGTLLGVFGGMDESDLALIRGLEPGKELYDALTDAAGREEYGSEEEEHACEKAREFLRNLNGFREIASFTSIRELIAGIIREFGYDHYVRSMPEGKRRLANLEMLLYRSEQFEKTSYRGLFRFIRYIENMKKYEIDFGEAGIRDTRDAVTVMSIHHSKGLEFPVVFVSGTGKEFNQTDLRERLIADDELGVGMDLTDPVRRTRQKTLIKTVISERAKSEMLGEELRVLYVAMTRAKEKLILTACAVSEQSEEGTVPLPRSVKKTPASVAEGGSFAAWIDLAFLLDEDLSGSINRRVVPFGELVFHELVREDEKKQDRERFLELAESVSREKLEELKGKLIFDYPHGASVHVPEKVSVSLIKHEAMEEAGVPLNEYIEERKSTVPRFISGLKQQPGGPVIGALRGTAYHTAFENMIFGELNTQEDVKNFAARLVRENKLSVEAAEMIVPEDLIRFAKSPLAARMARAEKQGKLWREQPFVIAVCAGELGEEYPGDETVMVQGIIDAFFEEDGKFVILDYKTDRVRDPGELIPRYRAQLDYYGKALRQLTGKDVFQEILYSVPHGAEVVI